MTKDQTLGIFGGPNGRHRRVPSFEFFTLSCPVAKRSSNPTSIRVILGTFIDDLDRKERCTDTKEI
jgi:hypothetical protein